MTTLRAETAATLARLLRHASLEVAAREPWVADRLRGRLAPGSDVFIAFPPGEPHQRLVTTATALRRAGFNPVPHVAARNIASFTQLDDFLRSAASEAGVSRALVIGGDADPPHGPFASSLDLVETGLFSKHGIVSVGFAVHPEGSTHVTRAALEEALGCKLAAARRASLAPWLATQFCFEAQPILAAVEALRRNGITVPLRIGLAGPASIATLLKYAVRCGIGNSLRALKARPDSIIRLLGEADPGALLSELAAAWSRDPDAGPVALHFFTFGGVPQTLDWIAGTLDRLERETGTRASSAPAEGVAASY